MAVQFQCVRNLREQEFTWDITNQAHGIQIERVANGNWEVANFGPESADIRSLDLNGKTARTITLQPGEEATLFCYRIIIEALTTHSKGHVRYRRHDPLPQGEGSDM